MKLVALTVKNYRSITSAHKLHVGDTTVLIGRNNEGKSNILRALVLGLRVLTSQYNFPAVRHTGARPTFYLPPFERDRIYNWDTDFPMALHATSPGGTSEITLEFLLVGSELTSFQRQIGSKLNGNLPIRIQVGRDNFTVSIAKQGKGAKLLNSKASQIADFVRQRLAFEYIPAVRTAQSAHSVVDEILSQALRPLEGDPRYKAALKTIADLQKPILAEISGSIKSTLTQFLPAIKNVEVKITQEERTRALRTSSEIVIDDGMPTALRHKGDGVQSLAAIALMRHASNTRRSKSQSSLIALEEPESHLHPEAIHELKSVLRDLGQTQQLVISTHCPLFAIRDHVASNIIVDKNKARPAESLEEVRVILGVRASDNLRGANLTLVVEGIDDVTAVESLLKAHSDYLSTALRDGLLVISPLTGAGNLSYKLRLLRDSICEYHCFLDADVAGRHAVEKAKDDDLLATNEVHFSICPGMSDSEIEDMYEVSVYKKHVEDRYLLSLDVPEFRSAQKWSERMRLAFNRQGKLWSSSVCAEVKLLVARIVAAEPKAALNSHKRGSFDGLLRALETRLQRAVEQ